MTDKAKDAAEALKDPRGARRPRQAPTPPSSSRLPTARARRAVGCLDAVACSEAIRGVDAAGLTREASPKDGHRFALGMEYAERTAYAARDHEPGLAVPLECRIAAFLGIDTPRIDRTQPARGFRSADALGYRAGRGDKPPGQLPASYRRNLERLQVLVEAVCGP
jgi:hypothetical protein